MGVPASRSYKTHKVGCPACNFLSAVSFTPARGPFSLRGVSELLLTETGVEHLPDGSAAVNVGPIVRALKFLTEGRGNDRGTDEAGNALPDLMSLAFSVVEAIILGGRKTDYFRQVMRDLEAQDASIDPNYYPPTALHSMLAGSVYLISLAAASRDWTLSGWRAEARQRISPFLFDPGERYPR